MSKVCSNCNAILNENQKFCTQCGTKYEEKTHYDSYSTDFLISKRVKDTFKQNKNLFMVAFFSATIIIVLFFTYNGQIDNDKSKENELKNKEVMTNTKDMYKFGLTIITEPIDATVKFLNIKEDYYDGIRLPSGNYKIKVSALGYETKIFTTNIEEYNVKKFISLDRNEIQHKKKTSNNLYEKIIKDKDILVILRVVENNDNSNNSLEVYFPSPFANEALSNLITSSVVNKLGPMSPHTKEAFIQSVTRPIVIASHKLAININQSINEEKSFTDKGIKENKDILIKKMEFYANDIGVVPSVLINIELNTIDNDDLNTYKKILLNRISLGIDRYKMIKN